MIKRCACGLSYTQQQWVELVHVGVWATTPNERYDMRQCRCRSTLSVELPEHVSVCAECRRWIAPNERRTVFEGRGACCSECGPRLARWAV